MKHCHECNKDAKRLIKSKCNTCYERSRRSSLPLLQLNCNQCGPVNTKKLTNGLCTSCYMKVLRSTKTIQNTCTNCHSSFSDICNNNICASCRAKDWRSRSLDKIKDYKQKNKDRLIKAVREWTVKNQKKRNAQQAYRKALQLKATPKWADIGKIREIYQNCPSGYHVDHIIPLRGKNICGLHIETNLQYLPAQENLKKSNKFEVLLG